MDLSVHPVQDHLILLPVTSELPLVTISSWSFSPASLSCCSSGIDRTRCTNDPCRVLFYLK